MTTQQQSNGFSIASLVLGIVAILLGFFGIGIILGILAVIFGIIGLKKRSSKPMAIVGIVLGGLSIITGIIFLIAFLSLPGLQQSQRDSLRRSEVSTVSSSIVSYSSNHQGALPSDDEITSRAFAMTYLSSITTPVVTSGEPSTETILYTSGATCPEQGSVEGARHYKLQVKLESGSIYCLSDS